AAMGQDGTADQPATSAVMLAQNDRGAIRSAAATHATATANGTSFAEVLTNNENFLAGFSSRGPANLLDIKPDVCAPGVNVLSSVLHGRFAMFQGTSMATPHVAGSSALLLQLHPDWTPAQVKGALVGTATRDARLATTNPQNIGCGERPVLGPAHRDAGHRCGGRCAALGRDPHVHRRGTAAVRS